MNEKMAHFLAPKRFHRSWMFWLGLTALLFLLWFWLVFSPKGIFINAGTKYGSILSFRSAIEFTFSNDNSSPSPWEVEVLALEEEDRIDRDDPVFKLGNKSWSGESIVGGRPKLTLYRMNYLSMRPWLPTIACLIVWLGVLWGWQRRRARLFKYTIRSSL